MAWLLVILPNELDPSNDLSSRSAQKGAFDRTAGSLRYPFEYISALKRQAVLDCGTDSSEA